MTGLMEPRAIGKGLERIDGRAKVTGAARYAFEAPVQHAVYLYPLQATIARGRITGINSAAAEALDGVLTVLTHHNARRLACTDDAELAILQSEKVAFRGQVIGGVVAETPEVARHAASLVWVEYNQQLHDVTLSAGRYHLCQPEIAAPDTAHGNFEAAFASAAVRLDATYTTPTYHNNPMEPHTTVAIWGEDGLTLYESTQGVHPVRNTIARLFGINPERIRVIGTHVGGGFGSKGLPHAPVVLAVMAADLCPGRAVKFAVTRQQMFALTGYRTPTIQRIRLAADTHGKLIAIANDTIVQTSRIKEYTERAAVPARMMYAAPNRCTSHRLARLDVPVPSWMRAPGQCPGMYALETAMDEMAMACGLDPIEFRIRNEPETDPETGKPHSSRNLVGCLQEGAHRFGWEGRDATPGVRRDAGRLIGTGVAASTYPVHRSRGSTAAIGFDADSCYTVRIGAADIGTGTWTALTQIAADALDVPIDAVQLQIGDTALPAATVAGGSSGITSWGAAIIEAARTFRDRHGTDPAAGSEACGGTPTNPYADHFAMHAYGAQFAEVAIDEDTGEIRILRMLGIFAAGKIINPRTARSQFLGGMTMGLSMALHEHAVLDSRFGHIINHDFAGYHIATSADIGVIEVDWLEEHDPYVNPMGSKGIGEIGIVGTAAAITNAAYHATGIRIRDLPLAPDKFLR